MPQTACLFYQMRPRVRYKIQFHIAKMPTAQATIAVAPHIPGGDNAVKTNKTKPRDKNMNSTPSTAQITRVLWSNGKCS